MSTIELIAVFAEGVGMTFPSHEPDDTHEATGEREREATNWVIETDAQVRIGTSNLVVNCLATAPAQLPSLARKFNQLASDAAELDAMRADGRYLEDTAWDVVSRKMRVHIEEVLFPVAGPGFHPTSTTYAYQPLGAKGAGWGYEHAYARRNLHRADGYIEEPVAEFARHPQVFKTVLEYPLPIFGSPPKDWQPLRHLAEKSPYVAVCGYYLTHDQPVLAIGALATAALMWVAQPSAEVLRQGLADRLEGRLKRSAGSNVVALPSRGQPMSDGTDLDETRATKKKKKPKGHNKSS